jgi:sulfonate transport system permease protein
MIELGSTTPRSFSARLSWVRWLPSARRLLGPLALLAIWALVTGLGLVSSEDLPSPWATVRTAGELISDGQLPSALLVSVRRVAIGLSIGTVAGVFLAVLASLGRLGDDLVDSSMQLLRTLPILAMVPLIVIWFGIGETPKLFIVALATAIPIYLNLYSGIRGTDRKLLDAARTLELSRLQVVRHVILPGAMAPFLVGLRYAAGIAWLVLVVSEQINATSGLGYLIINAQNFLRTDIVVVGLVVFAILGLVTDAAVRALERRALAWRST